MKDHSTLHSSRFGAPLRTVPIRDVQDAEPVYKIGDTVMHPAEGVCTITELRDMQFSGAQKRKYYILKPAMEKSSSTVYLPVSRGNTTLRRLLSREDILSIIHSSKDYAGLWISDSKLRKDTFSRILSEGDYARIIRMIQEIRTQNARREQEGKRPCAADEAIRSEAERLIHQEFSYVLHMSIEDTVAFIIKELEAD